MSTEQPTKPITVLSFRLEERILCDTLAISVAAGDQIILFQARSNRMSKIISKEELTRMVGVYITRSARKKSGDSSNT
jgi:hypothetical protein